MSLKIGSLFSGYGGLDLGVSAVLDAETAWFVEYDKAPSKILAHHWPDVPNYGDITKVDWSAVEPVDILTGGSPCQDLSHAGKRGGMTEGTRSNLWVAMREAIAQLRPGLVVWENVRGAGSAGADSDLEFCPGCMGEAWDRGPVLRALGRVVGDLADLGYVGRLRGIRAADIGAPHGRFRYFLAAYPAADSERLRRGAWGHAAPGEAASGRTSAVAGGSDRVAGEALLPTPVASVSEPAAWKPGVDWWLQSRAARNLEAIVTGNTPLLPTPAVNDMGEGKTVEAWDEWTAKMQAAHGNGNGHGKSLAIEAQRLLPTPTSADSKASGAAGYNGNEFCTLTDVTVRGRGYMDRPHDTQQWGLYADAIARWEHLTRPAPAPTQPSKKGTPQLSPAFSEWMMGLPAGHVTDVPGLSRNDMLKALGNGVVPQQAAAALRFLLGGVTAPQANQSEAGLLPTPVASVSEPAAWKDGVDWWLQSRAARNLEAIVTGNTPMLDAPEGDA